MSKPSITDLGKGYTEKYGHLTYSMSKAPGTIDCSNLVYKILNDSGFPVDYHETAKMAHSADYEVITNRQDIKPGDVVMFPGHTGIDLDTIFRTQTLGLCPKPHSSPPEGLGS